jgi:hypothetical protein
MQMQRKFDMGMLENLIYRLPQYYASNYGMGQRGITVPSGFFIIFGVSETSPLNLNLDMSGVADQLYMEAHTGDLK